MLHTRNLFFNTEKANPNFILITYNPNDKTTALYFDDSLYWYGNAVHSGEDTVVKDMSAFNALVFFFELYDTKFELIEEKPTSVKFGQFGHK